MREKLGNKLETDKSFLINCTKANQFDGGICGNQDCAFKS